MLTREERTKGPGTPPVIKGLVCFADGSKMMQRTGTGVYRQSVGRRLIISLGRYAKVLQTEIYAILACVYEIQLYGRPENCVSICSDSQAALKALHTAITTSLLVQQCQKVLNDISTQHNVGLYWVPRHTGVQGN
jgi:ribonuclease HI